MQQIIIAIDGHSSCGKTTLAQSLAATLQYRYISSGAMYRAVTLYFIQNNIDIEDEKAISEALDKISIRFEIKKHKNITFLNDEDVETEIKKMYVSKKVSPVSTISAVRRFLVKQQREIGRDKGIVMDGRDIGTVVFPNAALKIFLTAEIEERVRRRFEEFKTKGIKSTWEEVKKNLSTRDHIDSTREDSPLRQADDAVVIDNTHLNHEEQLEEALAMAKREIEKG